MTHHYRLSGWGMRLAITAFVAFNLGAASIALAFAGNGVISACYDDVNGNLRIATVVQPCREHETSLTWNQSGPVGATGAQGATGPAGVGGWEMIERNFWPTADLPNAISGTVRCTPGKKLLGGGADIRGAWDSAFLIESGPALQGGPATGPAGPSGIGHTRLWQEDAWEAAAFTVNGQPFALPGQPVPDAPGSHLMVWAICGSGE